MRQLLTGFLLMALAVPAAADDKKADAKPTKATEEFLALKKQSDTAQKHIQDIVKKVQASKDDDERAELQKKLQEAAAEQRKANFAQRFLDFARKNPADPAALDAVNLALRNSGPQSPVWNKAIGLLQKDFVKVPKVKKLLRVLAYANDEPGEQFVRDVLARNPDRATQARAAMVLLDLAENTAESAGQLKDNKELREKVEQARGKDFVLRLLDKGEKARHEQRDLEKLIKDKYADVIPDLSVGKKAPEAVGQDLDGKTVKLSDYKGKVVVLDIWATWCGPCRAMIPHERELVEKLKDKPFVLVSISADEDKETLTSFLAQTKMPWTHWWNGSEGGIVEDWNVKYFPTIYVLDAKGVIRHKDKRGKDLEEAVTALLKEAQEK
jgi:thiol-disulfide isomerase/thioredoxin